MKHVKLFEEHQGDKGYLGDGIAIMYHPKLHVLFIGKDEKTKFTLKDISSEDEVLQIKDLLKNINPNEWESLLKRAGYDVAPGKEYFEITKDK
jgi:hypothetical protein